MDKRIEKRKALNALERVIRNKIDIDDAFFFFFVPVWLKYGTPGTPPKFKKAYGIAHIIAKRDYEHANDPKSFPETGKQVVIKLMDVIVYGKIVDYIKQHADKDSLILIKGSRGMKLETIINTFNK